MKKIVSMAGAATGALSVIFSFMVIAKDVGSFENNSAYGGDAYTGIQNAAAQTAVNVYYLNQILRFGFFAILLVAGIALLCHYVPILMSEMNTGDKKLTAKAAAESVEGSEELKEYKALYDSGVLTAEEYGAKAREIMGLDAGEKSPDKEG